MAGFCYKCGGKLKESSKFCPECGTPVMSRDAADSMPVQVQTVQLPVCAYCGAQLKATSKFCPKCGRSVVASAAAQTGRTSSAAPAQYAQPAPQNTPRRRNKAQSTKISPTLRTLIVVLVVLLAVEGTIAGLWFGGVFGNVSDSPDGSPKALKIESQMLSREDPSATLCGVTIEADAYNLKDGGLKAQISDYGTGTAEDGAAYHEYDISLGEQSEYYAASTLSFPCDGNPEDYVILHEDHETGEWMPMIGTPDKENGTLTVYTDSFSKFRATLKINSPLFVVVNAGRPDAYIEISPNYLDVIEKMDKDTYKQATNDFAADPLNYKVTYTDGSSGGSSALKEFIINASGPLSEVIGDASEVARTAVEHILDDDVYVYASESYKNSISDYMTAFTVMNIGLQLTKDIKKDGLRSGTAAANLIKNICTGGSTFYSMATGYSSTAFTFTFFGVSMIGMGLDKVTDTAKGEQEKYIKKLMNIYYTEVKPFDADYWYEEVNRICRDEFSTTQEAIDKIGHLLDEKAEEFWTTISKQSGPEFEALMLEAGIKNIYSISAEQKAALIEKAKNDFRMKFNEQVLPRIEKDVTAKQQGALYAALRAFAAPFNKQLNFTVMERTDMGTTAETQYNGCLIAFGTTDKDKKKLIQTGEGWLLKAPESVHNGGGEGEWDDGWEETLTATDYAWMCAGMPDTVFVYDDAKGLKDGKPIVKMTFSQPHAKSDRTAVINLSLSQTYAWRLEEININPNYEKGDSDKVTDWSGSETELYVYWEETVDGEVKKYEDITCSGGRSLDFPSDVVFSCFYDDVQKNPSPRSQHSTVTLVYDGEKTPFPEEFYPADERNGNLYKGDEVAPRAMEDETFSVVINRGVYSLVYYFKEVPVEEKGYGATKIINNCKNEPTVGDFISKWYRDNLEGYDDPTITGYMEFSLVDDKRIIMTISVDDGNPYHSDSHTVYYKCKDGVLSLYADEACKQFGATVKLKDQDHILYTRGSTSMLWTRVGQ